MANQDWERFGEEILRNVQEAIDSRDYSMLNRTISDSVNGAVDYFSHTVKNAGDAMNRNMRSRQQENQYNTGGGYRYQGNPSDRFTGRSANRDGKYATGQHMNQSADGYANRNSGMNGAFRKYTANRTGKETQMPVPAEYYRSVTGNRAAGILLSIVGYLAAGVFLVTGLAMGISGLFMEETGFLILGAVLFCGIPAAAFGVLAGLGTKMLGRVKRFRSYIRTLAGREFCNLEELEREVKKSRRFVVKDLEYLIEKGWFRQGHLDEQHTCLMISNQSYHQYTDLMKRTKEQEEQRKREEAEAQRKRETSGSRNPQLTPEVREVIRSGEAYIQKIHACNEAIPGEEISAKISRMEMLVDKIFDRVEQEPESVEDLHRLMTYYLPTTVKLLEAYEDLDAQPIQGANILSSKQEIEKTLDTLNTAFEKLLDSLFEEKAWDVSSDISVLNTMLAQEGLTEDDFK